jgi:hypothetical protein
MEAVDLEIERVKHIASCSWHSSIYRKEATVMTKPLGCTNRQRLIRLGIHAAWVTALSVSLNLGFAGLTRAEEPLLTIEKAVWTDEVTDYQHGFVYTDSAPVGPLFLWMSVRGKGGALKKLQEAGKLPIYHKWYHHTIAGISSEGVTDTIDRIPIQTGKQEFIEELRGEISLRGFFNWRTWSMKENARRGNWAVKLVYADNTPVKCTGNKGCEYKITIK